MHVWSIRFIWCAFSHILFSVGCWCDPGYMSMGFWRWSQSSFDAQKSASCQMGWWCWIGIDCHCYRFACLLQSYLTMTTSADSTNIWKLTAGGRIVPRFQELSPEKLGKVSIFCTYFYFSNKEYARVKDVVYWCSLTHFWVPSYMNLESW